MPLDCDKNATGSRALDPGAADGLDNDICCDDVMVTGAKNKISASEILVMVYALRMHPEDHCLQQSRCLPTPG